MPASSTPPLASDASAVPDNRRPASCGMNADLWYSLLLIVVASTAAWRMAYRWDASLIDYHAFRQTQTAISTRTMLEGGPWLGYETPVLGRPWSIPFEFPTYQWLVAATVLTTRLPLDQAGRVVGVLFFVLLLLAIHAAAQLAGVPRGRRLIPVLLVLGSPLYIFWSRTFMIESTALAMSAWFLVLVIRQTRTPRVMPAAAAGVVALGMLAAVTKITTFVVICCPLGVTLLVLAGRRRLRRAAFTALVIAAPILTAAAWNRFADDLKRLNPMAAGFITSGALARWNFGTFAQKTSWSLWESMLSRSVPEVAGGVGAVAIGAAAFVSPRYRWPALVALLTFFWGPALFTNLYAVHNYYFYASGMFLLVFIACGFLALIDLGGRWVPLFVEAVLLPGVLVAMLFGYRSTPYSSAMLDEEQEVLTLAAAVAQHSGQGDVIAVYGFDWNPALPYYAHRRAFMDPWSMPVSHPRFIEAMSRLHGERIGAMVIGGPWRGDAAFVRQHAEYYGLSPEPVYRNRIGNLYVKGPTGRE
jgi:hypothetical protein